MSLTPETIELLARECAWTEDDDGVWQTSCGHSFDLNYGTPAENGMRFCCYCGGALTEPTP